MRAIRLLGLFSMTAGAALWVATCGGDSGTAPTPTPPTPTPPANRAPTAVGSISAQTVLAGESASVNVAANFSDPDGNTLSFAVASSDEAVATASASGSAVTISGISAGTATVTVTASDPAGLSATQSIAVTVEAVNQAPVAEGMIADRTLIVGTTATVDVAAYFSDPDGDDLAYAASSSDTTVATVSLAGDVVTITAAEPGSATVTVTATDPADLSASQEFGVTVPAPGAPPVLADSIPTHDVIVGNTLPLDVSSYFVGEDLTYTATVADEAIASVSVSGSTVTTTGVSATADSVSVTTLSVTATNATGGTTTQSGIVVRVHQEEYGDLQGLSVTEEGVLLAELAPGSFLPLAICLQINNFPVGAATFTVFWSEWQRAVGGGWITAQDNAKAHTDRDPDPNAGGSVCPINIDDPRFPPGTYRMIGHVQVGDAPGFYKTPSFVKQP